MLRIVHDCQVTKGPYVGPKKLPWIHQGMVKENVLVLTDAFSKFSQHL